MQWLIDIIADVVMLRFSGMIVLWSGTLDNIPDGWVLCDGNNGTPDLTEKFIVCAKAGFLPGSSGGEKTHHHDIDGLHTHTHTHPNTLTGFADFYSNRLPGAVSTPSPTHRHALQLSEKESSSSGPVITSVTGNLPPYYALAYIMKT